jgi:hypothetical protein
VTELQVTVNAYVVANGKILADTQLVTLYVRPTHDQHLGYGLPDWGGTFRLPDTDHLHNPHEEVRELFTGPTLLKFPNGNEAKIFPVRTRSNLKSGKKRLFANTVDFVGHGLPPL